MKNTHRAVDDIELEESMTRMKRQYELFATADHTGPTAVDDDVEGAWDKPLPTTLIQPIQTRPYRPKTHAERQTEKMRTARVKESFEALQKDVRAFHMLRDKMVQELAVKFEKKEDYIRVLLCSTSTLKSTRKPNLKNAILHSKSKELNQGSFLSLHGAFLSQSCT